MKVRAKRGVCVGVHQHLKPGDSADLDASTVTFLVSIGAVEIEPETQSTDTKPTPEKPGKKEKSS